MPHVKLLSLALALLTGVWVSAIAHQRAQSYAYRFLRPIADYTVIFNVGMLSLFFARYLDVNLPGQFFKEHAAAFRNLADLAISVLVVGLLVSMLRIVLGFRDKDLPLLARRCILGALAVIVAAYGARLATPATGGFLGWIDPLRRYILENAIILEIPLLVVLLVQAARGKDRAKMMRTFAYLYLSRYLVTAVIVAGSLFSFILALFIGMLTLRLRGMYFIIFTFSISELMRNFLLWWETNMTGTVGRWVIMVDHTTVYYIILVIFVMALLTAYLIRRSRFGLALKSIGEQEEAATHIGINATLVKTIAFAMSAFFMGAAGAIMATKWKYIDPRTAFSPLLSFLPVLMAIFGGTGQLFGPVFGAAIFAYLEEILTTKFPYYYMLLFGSILIVVILFLPHGMVGLVQKWRKEGLRR